MASRLRCAVVVLAFAAGTSSAHSPPVQAELFGRDHPGARSDGFRAAGRVPQLGVVELGYTRTQYDSPERAHAAAVEWRPPWGESSGFNLRAVERRDGVERTRTLEVGWRLRF